MAWYESDRETFLGNDTEYIVGALANAASQNGLHIEADQNEEWRSSVGILQGQLRTELEGRVEVIRRALAAPRLAAYRDVVLEYDFRRRGLRLDCVLLGDGIIAVVEFKRSSVVAADRDQVTNYCINLMEFHRETRRVCADDDCIVVPVLTLTEGDLAKKQAPSSNFHNQPWGSVVRKPLECDAKTLSDTLQTALGLRRGKSRVHRKAWLGSAFAPSSSILDAAISLWGEHDVSAIAHHAAPVDLIDRCTAEIASIIAKSKRDRQNRIIFVSGAPGAGKTLVGLKLAFDRRFRDDAVFVTGNAPLVDVLTEALQNSYRSGSARRGVLVRSGYSKKDALQVMRMSTFKIVKAHNFLGERGAHTGSSDGSVVIFDEAQRTYAKGKEVLRKRLEEDEAELILSSLERSYPGQGAVVVALVGHNQAINRGELGAIAWFKAAKKKGWRYAISDETLTNLDSSGDGDGDWGVHGLREALNTGHLAQSLRYYRNSSLENWASAVLGNEADAALSIASRLEASDTIWLTRNIARARAWARSARVGEERAGIIASGQARRLAAEGLFVELKPDIAKWMLAPTGDIRSSNMLETVQNQFQIQGLEMDYAVVCWDTDLRRVNDEWRSYRLSGADWQSDKDLEVAKNSYRVLLTRARKGMAIFVPSGDSTGEDVTRDSETYDSIAAYLLACGVRPIP